MGAPKDPIKYQLWKDRISETKKGNSPCWNKGNKTPQEIKDKISLGEKGIPKKDINDLTLAGLHERVGKTNLLKKHCEICGMSNEDHKEKHYRNQRLSMHCRDADNYTDLSSSNWLTLCEFGCHQKMDLMDRK